MDSLKGKYCPHIESRLPHLSRSSAKVTLVEDMSRWSAGVDYQPTAEELSEFIEMARQRVIAFGYVPEQVDILFGRIFDGKSWKTLAKEGWIDRRHAKVVYEKIVVSLKERGFFL